MKIFYKKLGYIKYWFYLCHEYKSIVWKKTKNIAELFVLGIFLSFPRYYYIHTNCFRFFIIGFSLLGFYPQKLCIIIKDNTADLTPALGATSERGRKHYFISTVGQQYGCISLFCVLEFKSELIFALNSLYLQLKNCGKKVLCN